VVSSLDVTFAQLYKEGELIPGASKQKVNDKICHYEVAYELGVDLFVKSNNRQDTSGYWCEGLSETGVAR